MITENKFDGDFVELSDQPLPPWASRLADNEYMTVGAVLRTRDGRICGNAYVESIAFNEVIKEDVATCYTDIDNVMNLTKKELSRIFYPPIYVVKIHKRDEVDFSKSTLTHKPWRQK